MLSDKRLVSRDLVRFFESPRTTDDLRFSSKRSGVGLFGTVASSSSSPSKVKNSLTAPLALFYALGFFNIGGFCFG